MTYNIAGIDWMHIKEFANSTTHSAQAIRNLVFRGNKYRPLCAIRDRSRILIAAVEVQGYPFPSGSGIVFHYRPDGSKEPCPECTAGRKCAIRAKADYTFDCVENDTMSGEIRREREITKENDEEVIYE